MTGNPKVLIVAAEAVPFAKVGGLAEFAGALPKALRKLGADARLIIPLYGDRSHADTPRFRRVGGSLQVPVGPRTEPAHLLETQVGDVPVYLIYNDQHFGNRERVYGFNDDPQRFTFFSRAVAGALGALGWLPDVIHTNDWHTAPVTTWLDVYGRKDPAYSQIASLYTIHNFAYQGLSGRLLLSYCQMNEIPHLVSEPPGKVNWMAQGVAHADVISTVSETYAREILSTDLAGDLVTLLEERRDRIFGILSGIDTELWDPETDTALSQTFGVKNLNLRAVNKTALQRDLRLPVGIDVPLMGMVTRLDPMKGLRLLGQVLDGFIGSTEAQFVLLGTGDEDLARIYQDLQAKYPQSVRALIRFDERIARRIYGGVDVFVMPSLHESVSVGLMTAMRYGAVPVVRATGGLSETVVDADADPERGTGFSFTEYGVEALSGSLRRALAAYGDEARWVELQRRAMSRDFSWDVSARAYLDLYERARRLRAAG